MVSGGDAQTHRHRVQNGSFVYGVLFGVVPCKVTVSKHAFTISHNPATEAVQNSLAYQKWMVLGSVIG
ncbi:MAG: hypothetical protein EA378_06775 [Phycisphaerales bacterium]|nr:MAG: hypothetical protein EA378_06775 [Phycisphaerales bacterium]